MTGKPANKCDIYIYLLCSIVVVDACTVLSHVVLNFKGISSFNNNSSSNTGFPRILENLADNKFIFQVLEISLNLVNQEMSWK